MGLQRCSLISSRTSGLQQEQPQYYENMMKQLNQQEQQILQAAVQNADVVAAQAAQANQPNGASQ